MIRKQLERLLPGDCREAWWHPGAGRCVSRPLWVKDGTGQSTVSPCLLPRDIRNILESRRRFLQWQCRSVPFLVTL